MLFEGVRLAVWCLSTLHDNLRFSLGESQVSKNGLCVITNHMNFYVDLILLCPNQSFGYHCVRSPF